MELVEWPWLTTLVVLPLLGALLMFVMSGSSREPSRRPIVQWMAFIFSGLTFAVSLNVLYQFDMHSADLQMVERFAWAPWVGSEYHLAIDGLSIWFVVLANFLVPVALLAAFDSIQHQWRMFGIAFLLLQSMMTGVFVSQDLLLFYIFFEGVLIPMFLIIGVWGGARRVYAAYKFFLYTLLGSLLMLVSVIALIQLTGTSSIPDMSQQPLSREWQHLLWWGILASVAIKIPMWPLHTWLPDAHVEAPTAGSVILAGVLLKLGGYGLLRISMPILPLAAETYAPLMIALSIIAIITTSLIAWVQSDMKKLIAYSSVAHMGFVTLGLFSFSVEGVSGAVFQMLSHGIVSAGLFLVVGTLYDRLHTRELSRYGGVASRMPAFACLSMVLMLASIGLPGTSGFLGEFLSLTGIFSVNPWYAAMAASGVIFSAIYMLRFHRLIFFGEVVNKDVRGMSDLHLREWVILLPLAIMAVVFGIYARPVLDPITIHAGQLIGAMESAWQVDPLALPLNTIGGAK